MVNCMDCSPTATRHRGPRKRIPQLLPHAFRPKPRLGVDLRPLVNSAHIAVAPSHGHR